MKFLLYLFRISRVSILLTIVTSLLSGGVSTALISLVHTGLRRPTSFLGVVGWTFAGLCVVQFVSRIVAQTLLARVGQGAVQQLRMRLVRRITGTPLYQQETIGFGRLMSMFTEDIAALTIGVQGYVAIAVTLTIMIACFGYIWWLSPRVGCTTSILLVVGGATSWVVRRAFRRAMRASRQHNERLLGHVKGVMGGAKELKLNGARREDFVNRAIAPEAIAQRDHAIRALTLLGTSLSFTQLMTFALLGSLFVLPFLGNVPVITLGGCAITILYMTSRIDSLSHWTPILMTADLALERINSLGFSILESEAASGTAPPPAKTECQLVELAGVTHAYHDDQAATFVLGPIDLVLRSSETVFIVGGNGSGKSTLAKLLTGLYTPKAGSIRLDGDAIDDGNRDWYRQHFSAVFADFHVFDALYGISPEGIDERAAKYLRKLQLEHKVKVRGGSFSTTALSQGQQKRLALLVSYLEDRPFYLFDEWAADQDPVFKKLFYTEFLPELKARGKGVVVITHDDQYFHVADRVIRLHQGMIDTGVDPALRSDGGYRVQRGES